MAVAPILRRKHDELLNFSQVPSLLPYSSYTKLSFTAVATEEKMCYIIKGQHTFPHFPLVNEKKGVTDLVAASQIFT